MKLLAFTFLLLASVCQAQTKYDLGSKSVYHYHYGLPPVRDYSPYGYYPVYPAYVGPTVIVFPTYQFPPPPQPGVILNSPAWLRKARRDAYFNGGR